MNAEQLELFPFGGLEQVRPSRGPTLRSSDPFVAALEPFSAHMRQREFSENTVKAFLSDLGLLATFLGEGTTLAQCTKPKLEEFLHYLTHRRGVACSAKSLERRITTLKVFFGWLVRDNVLPTDPAAELIHRPIRSPLPQVLSDREVEQLLSVTQSMRDAEEAPDARPHLLVTLILNTGIKKAECMHIALEHIDLGDPVRPTVYIHYDRPRQRFKARRLGLGEDWRETMRVYLRRYQPRSQLFECTPRNLEYVLHTVALIAGLSRPLTFETLRWTSALRSLRAGMDADHLRRRLGLSRIAWAQTLPILQKLAEDPL